MARKLLTAMAYCGLTAGSWPATAQSVPTREGAAAAEQVCFEGAYPDVAQVPPERRGKTFVVPATTRAAAMFEKKGFRQVECSASGMTDSARLRAWRDEVCELASFGNVAVQNQLERAFGERPAVLCALAERLGGPWEQGQQKTIRITR